MASASPSSTRCRSISRSRFAATATCGRRTTREAYRSDRSRRARSSPRGPPPAPRSPSTPTPRSSRRSSSTRTRSRSGCARRPSSHAGYQVEFCYEGGIEDFVGFLNQNKDPVGKKIIYFSGESEEGAVEVAMQWNSSYQESIFSFANNINTHEGGSHLTGFRSALTRTVNKYARDKGLLKEKDPPLSCEDVREGLTAVISAKLT